MISYNNLGFVNTREMFKEAYAGKYVIGAFNFVCLEQMQAITAAAMETRSPFIMQCSANVARYVNHLMIRHMAEACVEIIRSEGLTIPMALHLDHGTTFEVCKEAIEEGFSSVMIDGSAFPFQENIELTARVVEFAKKHDVTVEGELGVVSGIEEEIEHGESRFTDPQSVSEFVNRTGFSAIIDPRKFLAPARDAMKEVYVYKMREVFGCAGKAS